MNFISPLLLYHPMMPLYHLSSYTKRLTDKVYRGRLLSSHSLSASTNKSNTASTTTTRTISTDDTTTSGLSSDRDETLSMNSNSGRDDGQWKGACDGHTGDDVPTPNAPSNASHAKSISDSSPPRILEDIQFVPEDGGEEFPTGELSSSAYDSSGVAMDESTRSSSSSSRASTASGSSGRSSSSSSSGTSRSSESSDSRSSDTSSSDENDAVLDVPPDVMHVLGVLGLDGISFDAVVVGNEEDKEEEQDDDDNDDGEVGSSQKIGSPQTSIMSRFVLPTIPNLVEDDSGDFILDQPAKKVHVDPPSTIATSNPREGKANHDDDDYTIRRNRRLEALQAGRMERKKQLEENSLSKKMGSPTYLCMEDHPYALAQHERKLQELEQRRKLLVVNHNGEYTTTHIITSQNETSSSHGMDEKVLDELLSAHKVIHHQRLYTQYLEHQVRKAGVDDVLIPVRLEESKETMTNEARLVTTLQAELVKQQRDHAEEVLKLQNRITNDAWNYELRIRELEKRLRASNLL